MKKIEIDEAKCLKLGLTLQETLIAIAISMGKYKKTVTNMLNRGIITLDLFKQGSPDITSKWKSKVDSFLASDEQRLETLALKVQDCFPKQKLMYANGRESPFYFRCNKTEIKNKLKKFLDIYGEVSDDDIIDATKRYVDTYAPKGYVGMRLAKYFILKDDKRLTVDDEVHVEQLSDLATFLENKSENKPQDIVNGDDWLLNSRN
nr:MAG TPA: hypothetical protein [Caudoviricetes sp.]